MFLEHRGETEFSPSPSRELRGRGHNSTCHDNAGAVFLVPIVGAILAPDRARHVSRSRVPRELRCRFSGGFPRAGAEGGFAGVGVPAGLLQLAGATMAVVALAIPIQALRFGPREASATLSVIGNGPSGSSGLTVRVRW